MRILYAPEDQGRVGGRGGAIPPCRSLHNPRLFPSSSIGSWRLNPVTSALCVLASPRFSRREPPSIFAPQLVLPGCETALLVSPSRHRHRRCHLDSPSFDGNGEVDWRPGEPCSLTTAGVKQAYFSGGTVSNDVTGNLKACPQSPARRQYHHRKHRNMNEQR